MHAFRAILNNICVICFLICLLLFNVLHPITKLFIKKEGMPIFYKCHSQICILNMKTSTFHSLSIFQIIIKKKYLCMIHVVLPGKNVDVFTRQMEIKPLWIYAAFL